jgi:hypothetical protein
MSRSVTESFSLAAGWYAIALATNGTIVSFPINNGVGFKKEVF